MARVKADAVASREIFGEQIQLVCRLGTLGAAASFVISSLYVAVNWPFGSRWLLFGWYLLLNAIGAARVAAAPRMKIEGGGSDVQRWARFCLVAAVATGSLWGVAATVLFPFDHPELYLAAAFIVIGMPAGALGTFGSWWTAFASYVVCSVFPFALLMLAKGELIDLLTAAAAFTYAGFLLRVGRWSERTFRNNVAQRIEIAKMAANLAEARDAAETASRAKSEFLANMSHEIRTPLNAVIGSIELMRETALDERQHGHLHTIRQSAMSLLGIINDILDMSRIEAGRLELRAEAFALRALLRDIDSMFRPATAAKGLAFGIAVDREVPEGVVGDPVRLRQILVNLVGNAVKFTERGTIDLTVRAQSVGPEACTLRFAVADTGIGIRPEDRRLLFQPFSQVESSATRKYGGTGLGLRICGELAALMSGQIGVESEPGRGSTFHFTVQLGVSSAELPAPASARAPAASIAGTRVLLVEDNPINQLVAKAMLEGLGCSVETAADGREALAQVAAGRIELVLMDCQMPGMDGFEATRELRLREAAQESRLPVIALTANALEGDRERCLAAGMDDYLPKPFVREQLVAMLSRWAPSRPGLAAG